LAFGATQTLKGLTMTSRFLREEAARFRGMADSADREATRLRFLAMAADYDARANVADEATQQSSGGTDTELADPSPGEAVRELVVPTSGEVMKVEPGRKVTTGSKEADLIQRRAVAGRRSDRSI
jgi:hypothetical protein